ncbi:MAG TPA: tetratricopeptide repeat protein [Vicinamibacterales bacterium]|nr:tetratricopeptide repeat protein [Vicinamibacterales bacterium]
MLNIPIRKLAGVLVAAGLAPAVFLAVQAQTADKVPITTQSAEARDLYLKGRDLAEKLRATDARRYYEQAVQKDKTFALGYVGLANTSGTNKEFIDAVTQAAALAGSVSPGEQHLIRGLEANLKGDPAGVLKHYTELVRLFPNDERALTLLGNTYFGRQEYEAAISTFTKAISINPSFSQPYNQLGYAYRFIEKFDEAEKAFKKYTELIPGDPNPYDSYAELLMKIGRFDESIKMYEKALAIDANFIASHVGIGNNYLAMGKPDQARQAFARIASVARTTGERRTAHFWAAASYVHEGATDKALDELKAGYALAQAAQDAGSMSGDLTQMGDVLREAGRPAEALAKYQEAVAVIEKAPVPDEVKEATRRTHVFEEARVAVATNDLATAKARAAEYARQVAPKKRPFEVRAQHELAGMIALAEKDYATALTELQAANQQDPRILYFLALASKGAGDSAGAAKFATKAANFNGLAFNYAFVRNKARTLSAT